MTLTAANNSPIKTHGSATVNIAIPRLRRSFDWECIIANVTTPLLGADFLHTNDLLVDLHRQQIIDNRTNFCLPCNTSTDRAMQQLCPIVTTDNRIPSSLIQIFKKYKSITDAFDTLDPPHHSTTHQITTNSPPIYNKLRPLYGEKLLAVKTEFEKLEQLGIVRKSKSPWAAPLHLVPKGDGWRVCGDYRRLNTVTVPDSYPMANPNALYTSLHGCKYFTTLDLVRGYNQIPMEPASIEKTAVITPLGLYEYTRMPFGLCNAAQTFQRFMDNLLGHLSNTFVYLDDILIFSKTYEEHLQHLEEVLRILHEANLRIGIEKCHFLQNKINYLGYTISEIGIIPNKKKCEALSEFPLPETFAELHRFLGSAGFYRKHIPNFADKVHALYDLLRTAPSKNAPLNFNDEEMLAFESVKLELQNLSENSFIDPTHAHFTITSDASKFAIGGVLHQLINGEPHLIQFYSRKLTDCETRYSCFDRELLAAHDSLQFFLPYIEGKSITLFTDHKPLTYAIHKKADPKSDRRARQLSFISEHATQVLYIKGEDNLVADYFSRPTNTNAISVDVFDLDTIATKQLTDDNIQQLIKQQSSNCSVYLFKDKNIICERSHQYPRPVIPESLRYQAFCQLHNMGHPGKKASTRLIEQRYYWKNMRKDVYLWCKHCKTCQRTKITRHTKPPLKELPDPTGRFTTVHMDIVGPLPTTTDGTGNPSPYRYIVTFIDRYTRWVEACPVTDITAADIANALITTWIARFGVPLELITDRGKQFESLLFKHLSRTLGFIRLRTTAYNPKANGLIERQHRTLKNILKAQEGNWLLNLPIALLAMRITPSETTQHAPFTLVTGSLINTPANALTRNTIQSPTFVQNLAERLETFHFSPPQWHMKLDKQAIHIPQDLCTTSKVWVRVDRVKRPLEAPYTGPFEVLERNEKFFTVKYPSGRTDTIAVHRLKPYYPPLECPQKNTPTKLTINKQPQDIHDPLPELPDDNSDHDNESEHHDTQEGQSTEKSLPNHIKFSRQIPFKTKYGRTIRFSNINKIYTFVRKDYEFQDQWY